MFKNDICLGSAANKMPFFKETCPNYSKLIPRDRFYINGSLNGGYFLVDKKSSKCSKIITLHKLLRGKFLEFNRYFSGHRT